MRHLFVITMLSLLIAGAVSCGGGVGELEPVDQTVPYQDNSLTVDFGTSKTMTINMSKGAVFEGYLTVRGGDDDIRFYIEDSNGNRVLDINRVEDRYDFSYIATSEGAHTVYFDNSFSFMPSKQVDIHYRVR